MQTVVEVVCSKGPSLRKLIVHDDQLHTHELKLESQQRLHRPDGWAKLRGTHPHQPGALNIEWHSRTATLVCRVVNKGDARPSGILGSFINYLFDKHRERVKAVIILAEQEEA